MSRFFVTGGSGFIGGALISRLVGDGHGVTALARSATAAAHVRGLGAEAAAGDLSDVGALTDHMRDAVAVFHVAGANELCPRDELAMFRSNVTGTRNVIAAAGAAGVRRVVYTSSAVVLGEAAGTVGTEGSMHRGRYLSTYERSKHEAELVAFTAAAHHDVDVVAVNPSSVQGPGRIGGSAQIFLYALRSARPWLFDTSVSIVDIADCVDAHVAALLRGTPGKRYVISGATLRVRDAIRLLGEIAGRDIEPRMVPRPVVRGLGMPLAFILRFVPTPMPVCPALVRVLVHGHTYDGSLATRELGIAYTPVDETIRRSVAWYRDEGLI